MKRLSASTGSKCSPMMHSVEPPPDVDGPGAVRWSVGKLVATRPEVDETRLLRGRGAPRYRVRAPSPPCTRKRTGVCAPGDNGVRADPRARFRAAGLPRKRWPNRLRHASARAFGLARRARASRSGRLARAHHLAHCDRSCAGRPSTTAARRSCGSCSSPGRRRRNVGLARRSELGAVRLALDHARSGRPLAAFMRARRPARRPSRRSRPWSSCGLRPTSLHDDPPVATRSARARRFPSRGCLDLTPTPCLPAARRRRSR
jgi:hypothetical protein